MIPETLGRYRIVGELGRGAMGTVYRAHDPLIDREVAIKTLHPDLPEEALAEVRGRFLREAKSAGRLNHPNIVTIFDVGEQDGIAYMAMELLEGRSLQQIMTDSGRLPFPIIAGLVAQVADALDRAQQLGIVHRDVKPANVVVSKSGHVKLADFGVAYVPSSTMTQTGTMIGSPRYMSPEQVLGLPIDPRSDIFSLGVVLYEMLAGRAPFVRPGDTTIFPLINRIAAEPHPRITQLDPSVPAAFEAVLNKALAKKAEERYQRAGEMAVDLRRLGGGEPAAATTPGAAGSGSIAPETAPSAAQDEKTMMLPGGWRGVVAHLEETVSQPLPQQPPAPPPAAAQKAGIILDLDAFSNNFEAEEQARLRAEEDARQKKAEELRRWGEEETRKREAFERQVAGQAPASQAASPAPAETVTRRSALDLLKVQGIARPSGAPVADKAKTGAELDHSLRAALHYLAEVARELNSVNPQAPRPYEYVFLGRLPPVTLSRAFVDLRTRKIDGKDHADTLLFTFRIQPAGAVTAMVLGADTARCREFLETRNIPFKVRTVAKSDFGQVTRAEFTLSAALPCEVNIRADYDNPAIEVELVNVRQPGRVRSRFGRGQFDDMVDPLARYLLGIDDDFRKPPAGR